MGKECVTYRGIVFTRNPDSKRRHLRVYFWPNRTKSQEGVKALHVEIHKAEVGPVPAGWHVHHKDGDPLNNAPGNLETLTPTDHAERHFAMEGKWYGFTDAEHMHEMQELAKAWHASPEGRQWHSEHGKRTWEGRERQPGADCFGCGTQIQTFKPTQDGRRWCSRQCNLRWVARQGLYRPEKVCEPCGSTFRSTARTCSRTCGAAMRRSLT